MERGLSEDSAPDGDKDRGEDMAEASTSGLSEDQRRLEMLKLQFEWHKHLTTLTSGITLLVTTVSYTVFRDTAGVPHPFATTWVGINKLLIMAFALFFLGLLWSIFAMRRVIYLVSTQGALSSKLYVQFRYIVPGIALFGGVLAFFHFVTMTRCSL
jgi:uncharacterized membrane protein